MPGIRKIDTAAGLKLPGVVVMTGADLEAAGVKPIRNPAFAWCRLSELHRRSGHSAVACACSRQGASRGRGGCARGGSDEIKRARRSRGDTGRLRAAEPVIEIEDAEKAGEPLVWDEIRGNRLFAIEAGDRSATEAAFARAAQVVEIEAINNRVIINFWSRAAALPPMTR